MCCFQNNFHVGSASRVEEVALSFVCPICGPCSFLGWLLLSMVMDPECRGLSLQVPKSYCCVCWFVRVQLARLQVAEPSGIISHICTAPLFGAFSFQPLNGYRHMGPLYVIASRKAEPWAGLFAARV